MNEFIKAIFMSYTCGVEKIRFPQDKDYAKINKKESELLLFVLFFENLIKNY